MRNKNVTALVQRAESQLSSIRGTYEKALHEKLVDEALKIDIKNLCENLRSALDYIAHDIREKSCPSASTRDRFYFPILPDSASFVRQTAQWFPGLATAAPKIYGLLESIQPYQDGYAWLGLFNRLNNENKHGNLVEQTKTETRRVNVKIQGGGQVSWNLGSVRFGPGVLIGGVPVNPATQMPVPHPSQTVEVVTWVDFRFSGIEASALALLTDATKGVKIIADGVYAVL
jgi:hypothetical protein